jgi:enoyl-[acyl-carrier-protein] reductase (NADH)
VCPGPIDTAWTHKETGAVDEQIEDVLVGAVPLGRRGTVEEIANIYAFLASDEASYVTGALWLADGGITPAKGLMGKLATPETPTSTLPLEHTQDGLDNKEVIKK